VQESILGLGVPGHPQDPPPTLRLHSPNGTHAPIDTVVLHNVSQAFTKMGLFDPNGAPHSQFIFV